MTSVAAKRRALRVDDFCGAGVLLVAGELTPIHVVEFVNWAIEEWPSGALNIEQAPHDCGRIVFASRSALAPQAKHVIALRKKLWEHAPRFSLPVDLYWVPPELRDAFDSVRLLQADAVMEGDAKASWIPWIQANLAVLYRWPG